MESQKSVYISYTRQADHSFCANFRQYCIDQEKPWDVQYDETKLEIERSIGTFSHELSEAPRIIFLLSAEYFTSAYCVDELLLTYGKRAGNLLPIVVFVKACEPSQIDVAKIDEHWRKTQNRPDVADKIKLTLVWLLGRYDKDKNNWDILFPVYPGDDSKATYDKVLSKLDEKRKLRFNFTSQEQKRQYIQTEIAKIFFKEDFAALAKDFNQYSTQIPPSEDELFDKLDKLIAWLQEQEIQQQAELTRKRIAAEAKTLVGLLVLLAIDDEAITHAVYELNRAQQDASLSLQKKNDMSYQAIVSAIANKPAYYQYATETGQALVGQGQLIPPERGLSSENHAKAVVQEIDYREIAQQMYVSKGLKPSDDTDQDSVIGSMQGFMRRYAHFYLLLSQGHLSVAMISKLREELAEYLPSLQQIEARDDPQFSAEKYFLVNSGMLNQSLIEIYAIIEELRT